MAAPYSLELRERVVGAVEQDRPDIARRRAQWKNYLTIMKLVQGPQIYV